MTKGQFAFRPTARPCTSPFAPLIHNILDLRASILLRAPTLRGASHNPWSSSLIHFPTWHTLPSHRTVVGFILFPTCRVGKGRPICGAPNSKKTKPGALSKTSDRKSIRRGAKCFPPFVRTAHSTSLPTAAEAWAV